MPGLLTPAFKAYSSIKPNRIVAISSQTSGAGDFLVEEIGSSTDQAQMIGISDVAAKDARSDALNTNAAEAGDPVAVRGQGECCLLEMVATCVAGALIKPNGTTDGRGTPAVLSSGGAQFYIAIALQACQNAGEFIRVQVRPGWITT